MEVLGKQNIPEHGPIIFTGNHMNQFVDGAVILVTNPHRVGFLIAEKSFNTRIIGDLANAVGCIPVARPQDKAQPGVGMICFEGLRILGKNGTKFTQLEKGDRIRPGKSPESYKIKEVISDTEGILAVEYGEATPLHEKYGQGIENWTNYDILKYVDQGKMFEAVQSALAKGNCLGIFPEGGSHDNTDLLPLKAGVAAIALGVMDKYDVSVPIIPVGLNYFRGHKFRGRVVVEFGHPINITKDMIHLFREGGAQKRAAYQELLREVEHGMRSVIVTATDYSELKLIHTVRRMYQHTTNMPTIWKQDIARRFSVAYKLLKEKYGGELPADLKELQRKIEDYQDVLERWGLRDHQVSSANLELPYTKLVYIFLHGAFIMLLASIPSLILNAPVGVAADYWSKKEAQKDLKNSRVKVAARDVLLSKKIVFSMVAVPVLWITYAVLLLLFSPLDVQVVVVLFLCCPVFSYLGVMAVQAGMVDAKDLWPAFLRLLPSFRKEAQRLPGLRVMLQKEVRQIVKKYGPELGALYYEKSSSAWEQAVNKRSSPSASGGGSNSSSDNLEGFLKADNATGGESVSMVGTSGGAASGLKVKAV
eukprot:CAMPEP_0170077660 /NCGR_PEP_ID=MMETSP0019_2-20121128/14427_1 /TAXON_ID=98059 /ORGANISM="Dinobryon sp., Strain UTEXLB2267" /LENGTH=590 /DNA_ID=CAMNT_0010290111 /DNA_START=209 /DNA_END=1981 /DNA_ORIENTATION=-